MDSIRRSFKSHSSYKYFDHEKLPILTADANANAADDRLEVIVKINESSDMPSDAKSSSNSWREPSCNVWKEEGGAERDGHEFSFPNQTGNNNHHMAEISEDPPSMLISKFIHKQRASGGEMAFDVDLEMEELKKSPNSSNPGTEEQRVSYVSEYSNSSDDDEGKSSVHRRGRPPVSPPKEGGNGEVIRCTSNSSFQKASGLLRIKTRSRLMDPPLPPPRQDDERKPGVLPKKSGILKSGMLGKTDEDDEDPFLDGDLPEDYRKDQFGTWAILQWVSLILILAALVCSLTIPLFERQTVWKLHLWKWEVMVLALICGRLLSGWIIKIAVFLIERNFLLRKRVLYFVYGVRNAVQNCLWLGLVLLTWHYMFDKKVERETNSTFLRNITKVIICLLLTTLIWLVKTLLVKVLASLFHVSTYFDRIQEALFNQYVIGTLSGPPLVEIQHCKEEEGEILAEVQKFQNAGAKIPNELRAATMKTMSGRIIGGSSSNLGGTRKSMRLSGGLTKKENSKQQDAITIDQLHKLNQKNVSAWNMKRLMKIVRNGTLTTLDEQLMNEYGEDESATEIKSELEAKIAAGKIFKNVMKPGSK